jgi:hypothetical protein
MQQVEAAVAILRDEGKDARGVGMSGGEIDGSPGLDDEAAGDHARGCAGHAAVKGAEGRAGCGGDRDACAADGGVQRGVEVRTVEGLGGAGKTMESRIRLAKGSSWQSRRSEISGDFQAL